METAPAAPSAVPRLRRTLTLWDLIFYGIVLIQPIAPVPLYGVAQKLSDGHFVTIILIALFAMLITAISYGRMGALYPTAGSAYTYVGKGLNPHLGFLAGVADGMADDNAHHRVIRRELLDSPEVRLVRRPVQRGQALGSQPQAVGDRETHPHRIRSLHRPPGAVFQWPGVDDPFPFRRMKSE